MKMVRESRSSLKMWIETIRTNVYGRRGMSEWRGEGGDEKSIFFKFDFLGNPC